MRPDEITTEWLSEILGADVRSAASERIGDGLVGLNLRVQLEYADQASTDAQPASVVIKLPSLDETSRATGVALRNYEREVKFYDHIASTVDIRVPHCHHGEWHEESGDFVLVLEDMAPAAQGDQVVGCGIEQAQTAIVELAQLHGPRWEDPSLADHEFLSRRSGPEDVEQLVGLWSMFLPGFLTTYEQYLTAPGVALLHQFGSKLGAWIDGRSGPSSIVHGDYRLDNLLFATPEGGPPVTAVDWQTPGHGAPVSDLAYFCGAGLLPAERRECEDSLLDAYAGALTVHGVEIDRGWLWSQYRREAFAGVVMSVVASQIVGSTARSEAMFAAMASRHVQHCLDLDSLDVIG
jgi:hypothetical protein